MKRDLGVEIGDTVGGPKVCVRHAKKLGVNAIGNKELPMVSNKEVV